MTPTSCRTNCVGIRFLTSILLTALCAAIVASCGGGGGGDGGASGGSGLAAVNAGVAAVQGRNPEDVINMATETQVSVSVDLGADSLATDVIVVTLTDGAGHTATGSGQASAGAGTAVIGPIDASGLDDGSIELSVTVQRGSAQASANFGSLMKDSLPPAVPTLIDLPAGAGNPAFVVNLQNRASVVVSLTYDASANAADLVSVAITDGINAVETTQQNIASGGTNVFSGIDLSALADGSLTISARGVDSADNPSVSSTGAAKDTAVPAVVIAKIAAGGSNPENFINAASGTNVAVEVSLDSTATTSDTYQVTLTDSFGLSVSSSAQTPPEGGGSITTGIDASALADGSISITVAVSDANQNSVATTGTAGTKDTQIAVPVAAYVAAGAANAQDTINAASVASAAVFVDFSPAQIEAGAVVSLQFTDASSATVNTQTTVSTAASSLTISGVDLSALADGAIALSVTVGDAAANGAFLVGQNAVKDATAPLGHSAAVVAAGAQNAQGVINAFNASSAQIDVTTLADADATRTMTVSLTDGTNTVTSASQSVPVGGGLLSVNMNASGLADGAVQISVAYADGAGNSLQSPGTAAVKDTVLFGATAAFVSAGSTNGANEINATSDASVSTSVALPSGSVAGDVVSVSFSDGASTVVAAPQTAAGGSATMTFVADLSTLADGTIAIAVNASDAAGNSAVLIGTPAQKDTLGPSAPAQAFIVAGTLNVQDEINNSNATTAVVGIRFSAPISDTNIVATLSDGVQSVSGAAQAAIGDVYVTTAGLDASNLADGPISIRIRVTDAVGNMLMSAFTGAYKLTTGTQPVNAQVAATVANPANYVNATTAGAASVTVTMPGTTPAGDSVRIELRGSGLIANGASQAAPTGGGVMTFAVDASSIPDGVIDVVVYVTSANTNVQIFHGTPAQKDVVAPDTAMSQLAVSAGPTNPAGFVNVATAAAATVTATFDTSKLSGDETAVLALTSTGNSATVTSGSQALSTSTAAYSFTMNLSSMTDGDLDGAMTMTDAAGNQTTQSIAGFARLDVTSPGRATDVFVAPGTQNAIGVVNAASDQATYVAVDTPATADSSTTLEVRIVDSVGAAVNFPAAIVQSPGNRQTVGPADVSALQDGTLTITVQMVDQAGNAGDVKNGTAIKDTVGPTNPTAAQIDPVPAFSNPTNTVNAASQGAVVGSATFVSAESGQTVFFRMGGYSSSAVTALSGSNAYAVGNVASLADGAYTLEVVSTDVYGNTSTYTGPTVTKDTVAPAAPTSLTNPAGASNPTGYANIATVAAVQVDAVYSSGADSTATFVVAAADGSTTVTSASASVVPGSTVSVAMNFTTLADGTCGLTATVTDAVGNSSTFGPSNVTKDTVAPTAATAADVDAGLFNAINVINATSVTAVTATVNFPSVVDPTDTFVLDFGGATSFGATQVSGANSYAVGDLSALADGNIALSVTSNDVAGNSATFSGSTVVKDTVEPPLPTSAFVAATVGNPVNYINGTTVATVTVSVTWAANAEATATSFVSLGDNSNVVMTAATPTPGATQTFSLDASTLVDGPISVSVTQTDAYDNIAIYVGTPASKDTVSPIAPTSAQVAAGAQNAADYINLANVATVQISTAWPAGADAADTYVATVGGSVQSSSSAVLPGATSTVSVDASALADGATTVAVTVSDAAGNTTSFNGTSATKDTVAPTAPTSANVAAGAHQLSGKNRTLARLRRCEQDAA